MGIPNHDLAALEQRRLILEDNILQLQKSLYHWRNWEAEYDGIREDIGNLDNDASTDDFLAVGREFGGALVNEEEMQKILGSQGVSRSRGQVVDLLGRRIDYVKQNVATMEKRLRAAEDALLSLDAQDQGPAEAGADYPMQEIMEELDEDGEVISSSINTPGHQAPELLDVLKQAGIENIPENVQPAQNTDATATEGKLVETSRNSQESHTNHSPDCPVHAPETNEVVEQPEDSDLERPVSLVTPEDREQPPVTDVDESPEEARLRREMLQYGIDEVGAIVAELEMDEEGSDFSIDDEDAYDYDYDSGEEENEDEFGRSHHVLSDQYHQQMRELEAKLNARGMYNMGKNTAALPEEMRQEFENPAPVEDQVANGTDSSNKGKKPKKRVAFADDLDIAPASEPGAAASEPPKRTLPPKQPDVTVLSDAVVERTDRAPENRPASDDAPKKVSRFKSSRAASAETNDSPAQSALKPPSSQPTDVRCTRKQVNVVPSAAPLTLFPATPQESKPFSAPITEHTAAPSAPRPPEGKTLADQLVEREVAIGAAAAPEPDELDEGMHRREIASEFYKIRNRMIQKEGGFVNDDDPEYEIREGETEPKRISKFRAARMK
ncbi:hypothetical protein N7532_009490 [Penicillium argentinense]|uniref:DUF3835 domain-containing protein n=1 Tax=Penicillium argentinense TaxID=1131581 RepID=A0A9W9EZK0_9EURO|nr:uncharacterized protein N7532_009490 [Penicillium argentinense]KAJ5090806.1 hypothetical protein N7532_009490 [Penicillium argentinense]